MKNTHYSFKRILGVFLILLPISLFSQGTWKAAHLHFYNGEKLEVEVKSFISARIPLAIKYRVDKKSKSQTCSPKDISLIDFKEGNRYMRVETKMDLTPIDMNKLKDFYGHEQVDTTILVKEVVRGTYSLYSFQDVNRKNHFYLSGPKVPFHELRYRLWWVNQDGNLFIERDFEFRNELMSYRAKCIKPFKEPFELEYRRKEITKFVISLNSCEFN